MLSARAEAPFESFLDFLERLDLRLNNSRRQQDFGELPALIDVTGVERVEVVRGPASVLYGSDGIGGTVNLITKNRMDLGEGPGWDGLIEYRYSPAEQSHVGRLAVGGAIDDRFAFFGGFTNKHYGNIRTGADNRDSKIENTDYREFDVDLKSEFMLNCDLKLTTAWL